MKDKIRGVNLGGWLVLERWISPSVFQGVEGSDEHALVAKLGVDVARERLRQHWETFITKEDLHTIRSMGLNTVRLPVGYWLFADQDGFIGGAYEYVDMVFRWAAECDLQVILCLHGAPGSQNGNDHSGQKGTIRWFRFSNIRTTYRVMRQLCERYGQLPALCGIELINEPHVNGWWRRWLLFRYYLKAGRIVEDRAHKGVSVVMSDAFQTERLLPRIISLPLQRPIVDTHMYQLFSEEDRALDFEGHMQKTTGWGRELERWTSGGERVMVGEWSAAMDELYDPKLKTTARRYTAAQYRTYAHAQQQVFEDYATGWVYWTARTEDGGVWSLLDHPDFIS